VCYVVLRAQDDIGFALKTTLGMQPVDRSTLFEFQRLTYSWHFEMKRQLTDDTMSRAVNIGSNRRSYVIRSEMRHKL
jgi:hypothetical protein